MDPGIDRIVIAYFGLCESVTEKQLEEDASEDELLEEVLFDSATNKNGSAPNKPEQLAFLGIGKALYQLPGALFPSEDDEETADCVELEHCTLLFVPLEGSTKLVAILQINKNKPNEPSLRNHSLRTIQKAVRTHQRLFCLLEQWGVTRCAPDGTPLLYDGMEEIYRSRKQARKTNDCEQRENILENISALQSTLYIFRIREKLKIHYASFLSDEDSLSMHSTAPSRRKNNLVNMDEICELIHTSTRRLLGVTVVDADGRLLASTSPLDPDSIFALWRWLSKYHTMQKQSSIVQSFLFLPPTNASTSMAADGFLETPPLSQLSSLYIDDHRDQQSLPDGRFIWTPQIYFHISSTARVAFYQCGETSFLIFFEESLNIDFYAIERTIARHLPQTSPHAIANDALPGLATRTLDLIDQSFDNGAINVSAFNPDRKVWFHMKQSDANHSSASSS